MYKELDNIIIISLTISKLSKLLINSFQDIMI